MKVLKKNTLYFIFFILCSFLICGCSVNSLQYGKLSQRDRQSYDEFYNSSHGEIYENAFEDFDVKISTYHAVYDENQDIVGILITANIYPKYEKRIADVHLAIGAPLSLKNKIQGTGSANVHFSNEKCTEENEVFITYEPYISIPRIGAGQMMFSKPLSTLGMTKDEFIASTREMTCELHYKNGKVERKAIKFAGEITQWNADLNPNGEFGALFIDQ